MFSAILDLWRRFRESRDLAAANALINISRTLIVLVIFVAGLSIAKPYISWLKSHFSVSVTISVIVSVLVCIFFAVSWRVGVANYRKKQWNPDIWIKERHQICDVVTKSHHHVFHNLDLEILANGVSSFVFYIEWTGNRKISFNLDNPEYTFTAREDLGSHTITYRINFDYPKNRGDSINLRYDVSGATYEEENWDFFSHTYVESRTPAKATMTVRFSEDIKISKAVWGVFSPSIAISPKDPLELLHLDKSKMIVKHYIPMSNHRYSIAWYYI